jgi:hypothetical protein
MKRVERKKKIFVSIDLNKMWMNGFLLGKKVSWKEFKTHLINALRNKVILDGYDVGIETCLEQGDYNNKKIPIDVVISTDEFWGQGNKAGNFPKELQAIFKVVMGVVKEELGDKK